MILTKILDVYWMFLAHKQDVKGRYFFFSQGSNGAGKKWIRVSVYLFSASILGQI